MSDKKLTTTDQRGVANRQELADGFSWRDRSYNYHPPKNMETRHLFHTVRMIWNHTMPLKLEPYNRYKFGPFYTKEYMAKAVRIMVPELATRNDIDERWRDDLNRMINFLATYQIQDDGQVKANPVHPTLEIPSPEPGDIYFKANEVKFNGDKY